MDILDRLNAAGRGNDAALMDEAADEIARLRAEVEALRVDAGRYRWLRLGFSCEVRKGFARATIEWPITHDDSHAISLDAAIDAARGGK